MWERKTVRRKEPRPDCGAMTDVQLVIAYNRLAESDIGKELRVRTFPRFQNRDVAIAMIERLESSIRARKSGLKER